MAKLQMLAKALVVVLAMMVPTMAQAQSADAPSVAVPGTSSSIDVYRAAAVTAGVVGGAIVATIATEGLIIPLAVYAGDVTGASSVVGLSGAGYELLVGSMRLFGAIAGGFYGDALYDANK